MSDLDITIKLDPQQPVEGAKAVTKEVAKLEDKANDAKKAAEGIAKLNFKQVAAGVGQAFELINQKLKITDTELGNVVGSAVKFGATGAQIAGPWGAAIGAVLGGLLSLEGGFSDIIAKAEELSRGAETASEKIARLTKDSWSLTESFDRLGKNAGSTSEAIALMTGHIAVLYEQSGKVAQSFAAIWPALKAANQGIKDFNTLMDLSGASATKKFHEQVDAVNRAVAAHPELAHLAGRALASLTGEAKVAAKAYEELAEGQRRVFGGLGILTEASQRNVLGPRPEGVQSQTSDVWSSVREQGDLARAQQQQRDIIKQMADEQNRLWMNTAKWRKEMEAMDAVTGVVLDQVTSAASELSSTLVDAANGADVSWGQTFRNILAGFEKAIAQALVLRALTGNVDGSKGAGVGGGYGGLFGLLGFASGGTIFPSGSGTGDTQTVMFRKAPSETVHINTPQQEAAYRRGGPEGGGGPQTVRIVNEVRRGELYSDRDLLVALGRVREPARRLLG